MRIKRPCPSLYCSDEARSDALEALHKAALKHTPSRENEFGGYAATIIKNHLSNNLRRRYNRKRRESELIEEEHPQEDSETNEERELISKMKEIIEGMPHKRRTALKMKYIDGRSYEDIGKALSADGIPMKKGTVSIHLTKGLDKIRKEFGLSTIIKDNWYNKNIHLTAYYLPEQDTDKV